MQAVLSPMPETETFSTPPSTPGFVDNNILDCPSLSRRSSRPSSLRIQQHAADWTPGIVLDNQPSPDPTMSTKVPTPSTAIPPYHNGAAYVNGNALNGHGGSNHVHAANGSVASHLIHHHPTYPAMISSPLAPGSGMPHSAGLPNKPSRSPLPPLQRQSSPMRSPCFVHSKLQGPSFTEWLRDKHGKGQGVRCEGPKGPDANRVGLSYSDDDLSEAANGPMYYGSDDEDEETASSLTKQLAETAVGVREMSKQLGRTRVHSNIQSILIVTKARDNRLIALTRELALYLMLKPHKNGRGMIVYVDSQLKTSRRFDAAGIEKDHPELFVPFPRRRSSSSSSLASMTSFKDESKDEPEGQLRYWTPEMCSHSPHLFDFVVTLGGDGTVLFTSWLFQRIVPPVLPFALGSLGFLTNFDFADHQPVMDSAIDAGIRVNLRMRFTCTVYRAVAPEPGKARRAVKKADTGEILMKNLEKGGWEALEGGFAHDGKCAGKDKEIMCFTTRPVESFEVLNDLVVDRGPSPYVSLLELFGDEHHLTTVQADGLTISTPTGSTAYSLSAGGSLVHPEIPAILITPICPHTLSFRPMLLPDSMELRVCVPFNSRSTAWASFDGRGRVELKQGDHIKISASKYPFPTVCNQSQSVDWFTSISSTLKWNERERQKSFVVVEEGPLKKTRKRRSSSASTASAADNTGDIISDEEDEASTEEEDEKFDIDDLSSSESPKSSTGRSESGGEQQHLLEQGVLDSRISREKAIEQAEGVDQYQAEIAARALAAGNPQFRAWGSKSGLKSGVETPDRFAGPHPHPPKLSPRHVQFMSPDPDASSSATGSSQAGAPLPTERERDATVRDRAGTVRGDSAARNDMSAQRVHVGRSSRLPTREEGQELPRTPTEGRSRRSRDRSAMRDRNAHATVDNEPHPRRAFAVWGQDESDSAASDSDP